ncbi:hypothetical protein ACET3Z_015445 [Daucus carota]
MIQGYRSKSVRKRKNSAVKENISGNSSKRFSYPLTPLTPTASHSNISNCPQTVPQSTVSVKGRRNMRSAYKTPDNDRSASRTPLCDITNTIEDRSLILGRAYTATLKSKFLETTRNLFADEEHPTFEKNKHLQDDEIECSTMPDTVFSDSSDNDYLSGDSSTDDELNFSVASGYTVPSNARLLQEDFSPPATAAEHRSECKASPGRFLSAGYKYNPAPAIG